MLIIGEIGEVVKIALSVAYRKQSIIYFLIAPMIDFLWTAVHMLFGIPNDLFDRWSKRGSTEYNSSLLIAASVLCWSLWITRN